MGNVNSNGTTPLAMMAVARSLRLQRFQIIMMRESLKACSDESGFVDKASFDLSLSRSKITQPGALEIFELLFTMWDYFQVQRIPAKKFAVGIAPLACSCDDIASVLRFSLHINDDLENGRISPRNLHDVLISTFVIGKFASHGIISGVVGPFSHFNFQVLTILRRTLETLIWNPGISIVSSRPCSRDEKPQYPTNVSALGCVWS